MLKYLFRVRLKWKDFDIICYKLTMKIANIDRKSLHIFRATWEISMKFSGKMWFVIILKVSKRQGFTLSLEDTFWVKPHEIEGVGVKCPPPPLPYPPSLFRVNKQWKMHKNIKLNWSLDSSSSLYARAAFPPLPPFSRKYSPRKVFDI